MSTLLLFAQTKSGAAGAEEIPWPLVTAVAVGVGAYSACSYCS